MSAFFGADVDALRALGAQFSSQADELEGLAGRLTSRVDGAQWRGPDAERFRSDWNQRHSSAIRSAATVLRSAAESARTNASQQDSASAAGGFANATSLSGGPGLGGLGLAGVAGFTGPAIQYLASHSPGEILSDADGLLGTKIGPFELGSLGKELIPGAGDVTDTLDIASKISNGQVPWSEMLGVAAGDVQDAAKANPVLYLGATAVKVWLDAADQASKADFSSATMQSTGSYMLSNPADAAAAAGEAIVGWVPNLLDDFGLKL